MAQYAIHCGRLIRMSKPYHCEYFEHLPPVLRSGAGKAVGLLDRYKAARIVVEGL